jgi:hypothetical protein
MLANGVFNSPRDCYENSDYLSKMAPGCTVSEVYNAAHGIWDVIESFLSLYFGFSSMPVELLHKEWDEYFMNCLEDGIIIIDCHSQGAILTRNVLRSCDPEKRKRIHVIAVAPTAYIDENLCGSVVHFVSEWDIVPKFDFMGRWRNRDTTEILKRHPEAGWFDHDSQSPTYRDEVSKRIEFIRTIYGDMRQ